ncbi:MAG: hypothetical protein JW896_17300 [Deltaproteobacteria bacterium]|nr:hypothetical protein [Deltaproteobacteria bacterium]
MDTEGILVKERIDEILMLCDREQPIYEQISNFSIALYVFGYFSCVDLLDADDVDNVEAGSILKEYFDKIEKKNIPPDYHVSTSSDRYLLVIGDPLFPTHFAVVADMQSSQPYFSKLPFFGSGFDSLAELKSEFIGIDGLTDHDITYYKMKQPAQQKQKAAKIYTIKDDGNYDVLEYKYLDQKGGRTRVGY